MWPLWCVLVPFKGAPCTLCAHFGVCIEKILNFEHWKVCILLIIRMFYVHNIVSKNFSKIQVAIHNILIALTSRLSGQYSTRWGLRWVQIVRQEWTNQSLRLFLISPPCYAMLHVRDCGDLTQWVWDLPMSHSVWSPRTCYREGRLYYMDFSKIHGVEPWLNLHVL